VADDRTPATIENLAAWARNRDLHYASYGFGEGLLLGGTLSVTFRDDTPEVTVGWGDGYFGDFGHGLPLAALTGLVTGFLGLEVPDAR
jgi:hypothetical protein